MIDEFQTLALRTLARAELVASLAILLVFAMRAPARRLIGAELAYRLWMLPLAAALSSLFPTLDEFRRGGAALHGSMQIAAPERGLAALWAAGALVFALTLVAAEARFRLRARAGSAGPAVIGFGWHRLVTPADFRTRFTAAERALIRRHERAHMDRRDPLANLLIGVLQTVSWFNPLVHLAAGAARLDQELACDEAAIAGRPDLRRPYAEALLKAQLSAPRSPFACAFFAPPLFGGARHPLELRLAMLARPRPGLRRYLSGLTAVGGMALAIAAAVWAATPAPSG
jgi:beta-lactamase regulating signal transducer with metallopeptidase domain